MVAGTPSKNEILKKLQKKQSPAGAGLC